MHHALIITSPFEQKQGLLTAPPAHFDEKEVEERGRERKKKQGVAVPALSLSSADVAAVGA